MGGSLQRLEVLLVGLVLICAGAVVAVLLVLRPPAPAAAPLVKPQPIAAATAATAAITTAEPGRRPADAPAAPAGHAFSASPILRAAWPWLLLTVGVGGLLARLGARLRTRRLSYTNQSVRQLFAVSDRATRASNMQIMRHLADRGLLTPELAAATGVERSSSKRCWIPRLLHPRLPRLRVPRLAWLKSRLPLARISRLRLPPRLSRASIPHRALSAAPPMADMPARITAAPAAGAEATLAEPAASVRGPDVAASEDISAHTARAALHELPTAQALDLSEAELPTVPTVDAMVDHWTAEDRVLAVAVSLAEVWASHTVRSSILALDTASAPGSGLVMVTIDVQADEEEQLVALPVRIVERHPSWRTAWRHQLLEVTVTADGIRPPAGGPLVFPALAHGRGKKLLRFYPLATWQHLGIYGGEALGALHAILGSVLFAQSPTNVALAILDVGEITPLYREVPHLVTIPGSAREALELLAQTIRRGARGDVRPLLLVVIEPDDALLNALQGLVARLQARPNIPMHLIIVQQQLRRAGRELYALLPALLTSGGKGPATLLPGQGAWPKRGEARLVGRGMRIEGHTVCLDETAIAAQLAQVRGWPGVLPPVLWDGMASGADGPTASLDDPEAASTVAERPYDCEVPADRMEEAVAPHDAPDDTAQRQRIVSAMTARRQALMDTLPAATVSPAPELGLAPSDSLLAEPVGVIAPQCAPDSPDAHAAPVSDATALAQTHLADEGVVGPAPAAPDGHTAAQAPPHSRRAALLLATLDAGDAAGAATPSEPSYRPEPYAAAPLPQVAGGPVPTAAPAPMAEPENGWPPGPAPLGRVAMADLMARVVATPAIVAGQANELGVTKNRLAELLRDAHRAQAKELAETLMAWFDLAGLLVEPAKPGRLRHPRALATTELLEIAARLTATSCPDREMVVRMWAESHEGRN